jgi:acyl-coenzyme A thioesterase PaaI-like protein
MSSLYRVEGGLIAPQAAASSSWNAELQGGVALAALLTHLIEQVPTLTAMQTTRLTIDLIRAVPYRPLAGGTRILREGGRMQNVMATLSHDGDLVARAQAVRVRLATNPAYPLTAGYCPPVDTPGRPLLRHDGRESALEMRIVEGGANTRGPGVAWGRPKMQLLPDIPVSPMAAAAMMADVGSALSSEMDWRSWTFANVDLSIHFLRQPGSDWLLVDAQTFSEGNGFGMVDTILADRCGPFARAQQTLFVDRARDDIR